MRLLVAGVLAAGILTGGLLIWGEVQVRKDVYAKNLEERTDATRRELLGFLQPVILRLGFVRDWARQGDLDPSEPVVLERRLAPLLEPFPQIASLTVAADGGAGYRIEQVSRLLGGKVPPMPSPAERAELIGRTSGGAPLETLVRLFLLDVSVGVDDVHRALGSMRLDSWIQAGLLSLNGQEVRPRIRILMFKGLLVGVESFPYWLCQLLHHIGLCQSVRFQLH